MKEFEPDQFLFMGGIHTAWKVFPSDANLTPERMKDWLHDIECAETLCNKLGLSMSVMMVQRMKDLLAENTPIALSEVAKMTGELDNRVIDEMKSRKFFSIEPDKVAIVDGKNLFGEEVTEAFPSAIVDIEEAGKCLAFERWTATVFHLMRAMEVGLNVLGKALGLPVTTNQNWGSILKKCNKELSEPQAKRSPEWASDNAFFSGASAYLRSVKDAWRNPTMHVAQVYTEVQAEDIWNAVKAFMRQLSTKLKE